MLAILLLVLSVIFPVPFFFSKISRIMPDGRMKSFC